METTLIFDGRYNRILHRKRYSWSDLTSAERHFCHVPEYCSSKSGLISFFIYIRTLEQRSRFSHIEFSLCLDADESHNQTAIRIISLYMYSF